jgi:filamentous hemagglutinin family protein
MLARVLSSSTSPQQILGQVNTLVPGAGGLSQTGGELYLVNASGWLFGKSAQVNVGGLIASSLDVRNEDFLNGLTSINRAEATFSWRYAGGTQQADSAGLYQADGLVQVDAGAQIQTASGGRVFLFAPTVVNNGHISTPDGQTALAGGAEVFLNNPAQEKLYASEVNANVPAVKGLLVEVNNGPAGQSGSVTNAAAGHIESMRGNTTLVGMMVRQSGRISASTSSTANGSVLLTARSGVVTKVDPTVATDVTKQAQSGGTLVLGAGSEIVVQADESAGATTASTPFTRTRVALAGKTIDMLDNARIVAPGATVDVRAEATPVYYGSGGNAKLSDARELFNQADSGARITLGSDARIDVSGTETAEVDAAKRNFVRPELITNSDLKDAPLQKDGPVFHLETAVFDARSNVPMLSTLQAYRDAQEVSATERLASGGTVNLRSMGAVVTHANATIDISGGKVKYSAVGVDGDKADVQLTTVVDASGRTYTLNQAPANVAYVGLGKSVSVQEASYEQGAAAGSLNVTGNQIVMPGKLVADTVTGARQAAGLDALATGARVTVRGWASTPDLTGGNVQAALDRLKMTIGQNQQGAASAFWQAIQAGQGDQARARLTAGSMLDLSMLATGGSALTVDNDGAVHWLSHNDRVFNPGVMLTINSRGGEGVRLDSHVRNAAGVVTLQAGQLTGGGAEVYATAGGVTLGDGVRVDVSGRFVNQALDGPQVAAVGTSGGRIVIDAMGDIHLGQGSVLDVSGGAVWTGQALLGKDAGALQVTVSNPKGGQVVNGAEMRGFSLTKGGTLQLSANDIHIGDEADGALNLGTGFFGQQGFGSFTLNGVNGLTVASGAQLQARQLNWLSAAGLTRAKTDTALRSLVRLADKGDHLRAPTSLTLNSALGSVVVARGAKITTDELATVSLKGNRGLDFEGSIVNPGGTVSLTVDPTGSTVTADRRTEPVLWLGAESSINVSGISVLTPGTGIQRQGKVLDGGTVNLSAGGDLVNGAMVVMAQGASIQMNGALDRFDTRVGTALGGNVVKLDTASAGGVLNVATVHGAVLEGTVSARGGNSAALDGALNLTVGSGAYPSVGAPDVLAIGLTQKVGRATAGLTYADRAAITTANPLWGHAQVAGDWLSRPDGSAGFADVSLVTGGRIEGRTNALIAAGRSLTLSSRSVAVADGQTLTLKAPKVSLGDAQGAQLSGGLAYLDTGAEVHQASGGTGKLRVAALYAELNNQVKLQGVGAFQVRGLSNDEASSAAAVAMSATTSAAAGLATQADIDIRAAVVFPSTDTRYTIDAPGHTVRFSGGDTSLAAPLSAGGTLTVNAAKIEQDGVLRAPFGQIALNANDITLGDGSLTSVSGSGLLVPFGSTINGSQWVYATDADKRTALVDKQIVLNAGKGSGTLTVNGSAQIDTSGGGDLYAREFVAGPGGSTDIFAGAAAGAFAVVPYTNANALGFAVYDRATLLAADASGKTASLQAGQQITFGHNGVVPAGTYVVLPAAYASIPGAYLVKADTTAGRNGGATLGAATVALPDGSASVVGAISYAGSSYGDTIGRRYVVMPSAVSSKYAQVNLTSANSHFAALAGKAAQAASGLPQDGGAVSILAGRLPSLKAGALHMGGEAGNAQAYGGMLDLGLSNILVGGSGPANAVSWLSLDALNGSGAQSVLLGATRGEVLASGERELTVRAAQVAVQASRDGATLTAPDVTLVASDTVDVGQGVTLSAAGPVRAEAYHVSGDGASVRVSAASGATLSRSDATQQQGTLNVADGVKLSSAKGAVLVDAARSMRLADTASLSAKAVGLAAPRLVLGDPADLNKTAGALWLNPSLLAQLGQAGSLGLRTYSSIDFYNAAGSDALTLGGTNLASLTLDAGTLQGHDGANVTLTAGAVRLANTSGAASQASRDTQTDTGRLTVQATQGDLTLSTGSVQAGAIQASTIGVSGFAATQLTAAGQLLADGQGGTATAPGGLTAAGDLTLTSTTLTSTSAANTAIVTDGKLTLASSGTGSVDAGGLGARMQLTAQAIDHQGTIALRSGALTMTATGSGQALTVGSQARIAAQGVSAQVGSQTVDTQGGIVNLVATQGDIQLQAGSSVDVSAAGAAAGGQLLVQAAAGKLTLDGQLLGTTAAGSPATPGAQLTVLAQTGLNLDALADAVQAGATPAAGAAAARDNFRGAIQVRTLGKQDLTLSSDRQFKADTIGLVADQGALTVRGGLHADTAQGGTILLAANQDLTTDGAQLSAQATATDLKSGSTGRIDLQSAQGKVRVLNHTQVDLSAATPGVAGGLLAMRAGRDAAGTGVKVDPLSLALSGARAVQVEGVKVWQTTAKGAAISTLDTTGTAAGALSLASLTNDASAYTATARVAAMKTALAGSDAQLASLLDVRAGEEVRSAGHITLGTSAATSAWAITTPMNLTVRAGGDLTVNQTLSAGFTNATTTATPLATAGSDLTLVAGADRDSASSRATVVGGTGDLRIGNSGSTAVAVRTTTGDIQLAAAGNVELTNAAAAVYTTGRGAASGDLLGWSALPASTSKTGDTMRTTAVTAAYTGLASKYQTGAVLDAVPFYTGGGSVAVQAGGDVLGASGLTDAQAAIANWFYTAYSDTAAQSSWWTRSDTFKQGIATLGGGNVQVKAGGAVQDLTVAAAGAGYTQQGSTTVARDFGAGNVWVQAQGDVLGSTVVGTGARTVVLAGGSMGGSARGGTTAGTAGLSLLTFNGRNTVRALGDIQLAGVGSAVRGSQFLVQFHGSTVSSDAVANQLAFVTNYSQALKLAGAATLDMATAGGSVKVSAGEGLFSPVLVNASTDATKLTAMDSFLAQGYATSLNVAAPTGSINLSPALYQKLGQGQGAPLTLLAGRNLSLTNIYQRAAAPGGANDALGLGLDTSSNRSPVVLVAGQGDLILGDTDDQSNFQFVRPLLAEAGRDLKVQGSVTIQHQGGLEQSTLQAGRDLNFIDAVKASDKENGLTVRGAGDVLLAAGRDLNLGARQGVVAEGNASNSALASGSAHVSLMAGTKLSSLDASLALSEGRLPQLLGGLAYLTAMDANTELAAVRNALALLGASVDAFDASYDAALAAYVVAQGPAYAGLNATQLKAAFKDLPAEARTQFTRDYLSAHVLGQAGAATASSPQDFHLLSLIGNALKAAPADQRIPLAVQLADTLKSPYGATLLSTMSALTGRSDLTLTDAMTAFAALPHARQALVMQRVLDSEVREAGRSAVVAASTLERDANYQRGYDAVAAMFSPLHAQAGGDLLMPLTKVRNFQGGDINILVPAGSVNGGLTSGSSTNFGVVALGGGDVNAVIHQDYLVNTSRVFTLDGGNVLMWSSEGNIDAGKGARTVQNTPPPVYYVDSSGRLQVDTTSAIAGSGIASSNTLDIYAPHGIVDSGDAGLRAQGEARFGGVTVVCLGCSFNGPTIGLPSALPAVAAVAPVAALPDNTRAGLNASHDDEDKKKKSHKRQIQVDFLGFGVALVNPLDFMLTPGLSQWWAQRQAAWAPPVQRWVTSMLGRQGPR